MVSSRQVEKMPDSIDVSAPNMRRQREEEQEKPSAADTRTNTASGTTTGTIRSRNSSSKMEDNNSCNDCNSKSNASKTTTGSNSTKSSLPLLEDRQEEQDASIGSAPAGSNLGRRGDPRMHKAVAFRLSNPKSSLLEALIVGGFKFPKHLFDAGLSDDKVHDTDGVQLSQRKNQLGRRLRLIRNKKSEDDSNGGAANSTKTTHVLDTHLLPAMPPMSSMEEHNNNAVKPSLPQQRSTTTGTNTSSTRNNTPTTSSSNAEAGDADVEDLKNNALSSLLTSSTGGTGREGWGTRQRYASAAEIMLEAQQQQQLFLRQENEDAVRQEQHNLNNLYLHPLLATAGQNQQASSAVPNTVLNRSASQSLRDGDQRIPLPDTRHQPNDSSLHHQQHGDARAGQQVAHPRRTLMHSSSPSTESSEIGTKNLNRSNDQGIFIPNLSQPNARNSSLSSLSSVLAGTTTGAAAATTTTTTTTTSSSAGGAPFQVVNITSSNVSSGAPTTTTSAGIYPVVPSWLWSSAPPASTILNSANCLGEQFVLPPPPSAEDMMLLNRIASANSYISQSAAVLGGGGAPQATSTSSFSNIIDGLSSLRGLNLSQMMNIDAKVNYAVDIYNQEHQHFISKCLVAAGLSPIIASDVTIRALFNKKLENLRSSRSMRQRSSSQL